MWFCGFVGFRCFLCVRLCGRLGTCGRRGCVGMRGCRFLWELGLVVSFDAQYWRLGGVTDRVPGK